MFEFVRRFLPDFSKRFLPADAQALAPVPSSTPAPGYDQVGQAMLRVADLIEREPERYDFMRTKVPGEHGAGCLIGLVGKELGVPKGKHIYDVLPKMRASLPGGPVGEQQFYDRMGDRARHPHLSYQVWTRDPRLAAQCLRRYAHDYHWVMA